MIVVVESHTRRYIRDGFTMVSARTSVVAERTNDIILFEYAAYDVELVHTRHRCHQIGPNGMGCLL
mgnify:CR=1 FL=1